MAHVQWRLCFFAGHLHPQRRCGVTVMCVSEPTSTACGGAAMGDLSGDIWWHPAVVNRIWQWRSIPIILNVTIVMIIWSMLIHDDHLLDIWCMSIYIYCVFVWVIVVSNNYWPSWSIMHNHRQSASVLINHHQLGPSKILGFPLWKPPYVSSSLASSMSHKTLDVAPLPLLPDQDDPTGDVPIASGWSKVHTPGCSHSHSS